MIDEPACSYSCFDIHSFFIKSDDENLSAPINDKSLQFGVEIILISFRCNESSSSSRSAKGETADFCT